MKNITKTMKVWLIFLIHDHYLLRDSRILAICKLQNNSAILTSKIKIKLFLIIFEIYLIILVIKVFMDQFGYLTAILGSFNDSKTGQKKYLANQILSVFKKEKIRILIISERAFIKIKI